MEDGTIPACAGQSSVVARANNRGGDHPRVCGAKQITLSAYIKKKGPSPRVRGKGLSNSVAIFSSGTIPACAGQSFCTPAFGTHYWDHPRVCGAKQITLSAYIKKKGPSPRVRGKEDITSRRARTPGPSPRVRGKAFSHRQSLHYRGTIPACAGQRSKSVAHRLLSRDHPRVCGAKPVIRVTDNYILGPSPRVRGKGLVGTSHNDELGTIPACAGQRLPDLLFYNPRRWF